MDIFQILPKEVSVWKASTIYGSVTLYVRHVLYFSTMLRSNSSICSSNSTLSSLHLSLIMPFEGFPCNWQCPNLKLEWDKYAVVRPRKESFLVPTRSHCVKVTVVDVGNGGGGRCGGMVPLQSLPTQAHFSLLFFLTRPVSWKKDWTILHAYYSRPTRFRRSVLREPRRCLH